MNFIQRIHNHGQTGSHVDKTVSSQSAPFWVRHYDKVVNVITLGRTRTIHRQTVALAELRPSDAILDVGCGTGALLVEAQRSVGPDATLVGLDVEPAMIEQARQRASKYGNRAHFEVASVDQIPYPDDTFDVAFSTLMYHHLSEQQRTDGFSELERVLKAGGQLILVDINPNRRSILTSLPGHSNIERQDYVRDEVAERMQKAGFTIVATGAHPSRQLSYAVAKKV